MSKHVNTAISHLTELTQGLQTKIDQIENHSTESKIAVDTLKHRFEEFQANNATSSTTIQHTQNEIQTKVQRLNEELDNIQGTLLRIETALLLLQTANETIVTTVERSNIGLHSTFYSQPPNTSVSEPISNTNHSIHPTLTAKIHAKMAHHIELNYQILHGDLPIDYPHDDKFVYDLTSGPKSRRNKTITSNYINFFIEDYKIQSQLLSKYFNILISYYKLIILIYFRK